MKMLRLSFDAVLLVRTRLSERRIAAIPRAMVTVVLVLNLPVLNLTNRITVRLNSRALRRASSLPRLRRQISSTVLLLSQRALLLLLPQPKLLPRQLFSRQLPLSPTGLLFLALFARRYGPELQVFR